MKRSLFFFAACFIAVAVISSCEQSREVSNLEQNLNEIINKYGNWTDNELARESIKTELVSFFNDSKGKSFQSFYNGELDFDEVITTPEGHNNNTDSVAARFNCSLSFYPSQQDNSTWIKFVVVGKLPKDEAIKLNRETKYRVDGNILGYIEDVNIDRLIGRIEMGMLVMEELKFLSDK